MRDSASIKSYIVQVFKEGIELNTLFFSLYILSIYVIWVHNPTMYQLYRYLQNNVSKT